MKGMDIPEVPHCQLREKSQGAGSLVGHGAT